MPIPRAVGVAMIQAVANGDDAMFRRVVNAMIRDMEGQGRLKEAAAYTTALAGPAPNPLEEELPAPVIDAPSGSESYCYLYRPRKKLGDMVLDSSLRRLCDELILEKGKAALLRRHGLEPRRKVILNGPPGNGKTALIGALSEAMHLPCYFVRCAGLVGSLVGESEKRVANLLRHFSGERVMIFFDEADSLLTVRGSVKSDNGGAIRGYNATTNTILTQMDELRDPTYLMAATNMVGMIDPAILRRFDCQVELPLPGAAALAEYFRWFCSQIDFEVELDADAVGAEAAARRMSFANLEGGCYDALRQHVLNMPKSDISLKLIDRLNLRGDVLLG